MDSTTWSDGANASNVWTFDVSGTDTTITFGSGLATFSNGVTVTGVLATSGGLTIDATTESNIESALDTLSSVTTVGALNAGSITSGFGAIDTGADAITTSGTIGTAATTTFTGAGATFTSALAANGGITLDASTDTIGAFTAAGTIDMNTQILSGTTGRIDYTNFDVGATGNTDIGGTITAGSGNTAVTLSTGMIDADAISLVSATNGFTGTSSASGLATYSDTLSLLQGCSDGQILKWVESTDTWDCGADSAGGGLSDADYGDIIVSGTGTVFSYDMAAALSGDHTMGANEEKFGVSGLIFEGSSADTIETYFSVTNPTGADKTITFADRSGTVSLSGDTFTGDVTGTIDTDGSTALTIAADSVTEAMLKAVDTPADEECMTYESTTGDFEWQPCGDVNKQTFTADGTWTKPADALLVIAQGWGGGGGGGGGTGGTTAATRSGGGGGGGGAYNQVIFNAADLASSLEVNVADGGSVGTAGSSGVGGNGGAGENTCMSASAACGAPVSFIARSGGGGAGAGTAGNGGGGGAGFGSGGGTATSATGGTGGTPGGAVDAVANGFEGAGGGTSGASTGASVGNY